MTGKKPESTTSVFKRFSAEMDKGHAIGLTLAGGVFAAATGSPAVMALTVLAAVNTGVAFYIHRSLDA